MVNGCNQLYTEIKIYNVTYARNLSNFNPTLTETGTLIQYDFSRYVESGKLTYIQEKEIKFKFHCFNSSLTVRNFYFNEVSSYLISEEALFSMKRAPYKWLNVYNCRFKLMTAVGLTVEGINMNF